MALIGAGRVATALAVLLERAGHRVVAASGRKGSADRVRHYLPFARFHRVGESHEAARAATVVLLGVPDDLIEEACAHLAAYGAVGRGQIVAHLSGSLGLGALTPATTLLAEALSLHPLQSVPTVDEGIARLPGSSMAVTASDDDAFAAGMRLARDAGCRPFGLDDQVKPLYHAAAVFCSNYLVAVEAMAEHLFRLAGLDDPLPLFAPLARASLDAALDRGPEAALTGPAVRGDVGTIRRNLTALEGSAPEAVATYIELARMAAELGVRARRLSTEDQARVMEALQGWT